MPDDIAISAQTLTKAYRIWETPTARLTSPLLEAAGNLGGIRALKNRAARGYRDFLALKDISFEVKKGEAVGIIGRNGSGKSTLLQIIAGTLQPTTGSVKVNGRIAALLELGSGFNPDFTGRENVFLNGAVLGLSQPEVEARFPAIAEFADIGDFINQPVRTYSSGMVIRLAFAVAAHVDPDILIVDEALSVGDARFQLKCARAIDRFIGRGVTLLFVSHDAAMVKRLCNRALLLEQGRVLYAGVPNDVVNLYSKLTADGGTADGLAADIAVLQRASSPANQQKPPPSPSATPGATTPTAITVDSGETDQLRRRVKALETLLQSRPDSAQLTRRLEALWQDERRHNQLTGQEFSYGGELGKIHQVLMLDRDGQARTWFTSGEPVTVRMTVEAHEDFPEPIFALTIKSAAGVEIYGTNTLFSKQPTGPIGTRARREINFSFDLSVMPGNYFISVGFTHFVGEKLVVIHRRYDVIKVEVHGVDHTFGIINLHAGISSRDLAAEASPANSPDPC